MLEKKYDYINGNTVQKPLRRERSLEEQQRRERLERKTREKNRKLKKKQVTGVVAVAQVAIVFLTLGFITIWRDGNVYEMQRKLTGIGNEMKVIDVESEALKVSLLKGASLENIEKYAKEKLGMVTATKNDVTFIDTSEDFLGELKEKELAEENNQKEEGFFSKITGMFN